MFMCQCGRLKKSVEELNDVMRDLLCPRCHTKLRENISKQSSLEMFIEINKSEETETRRKKVYDYLLGVDDATDWEIMKALGYKDRNSISPRRNELVKGDLVEEHTKRLCAVSGNNITAWRAK